MEGGSLTSKEREPYEGPRRRRRKKKSQYGEAGTGGHSVSPPNPLISPPSAVEAPPLSTAPSPLVAAPSMIALDLQQKLSHRPSPESLVSKNIFKGTTYRAAHETIMRLLQKDTLARSLRNRSGAEDLRASGILRESSLVKGSAAQDILSQFLSTRPAVDDLYKREVLKDVLMLWTELEIHGSMGTLPAPRHYHTLTLVGRQCVLVGGLVGGEDTSPFAPTLLDPDSSLWHTPTALSLAGFHPYTRYAHSAIAYGRFLIIFGGFGGQSWLNDVWILDVLPEMALGEVFPKQQQQQQFLQLYNQKLPSQQINRPGMTIPPGFYNNNKNNNNSAACAVPLTPLVSWERRRGGAGGGGASGSSGGGLIGSSGGNAVNNTMGRASQSGALQEFVCWHLPSIGGTPPPPRAAHTAVSLLGGHLMLVFGGCDGSRLYNDTWGLALASPPLRWLPLHPTGTPPSPRSGHSAVAVKDGTQIIVFGGGEGWGGETYNDVFVLDARNLNSKLSSSQTPQGGGGCKPRYDGYHPPPTPP